MSSSMIIVGWYSEYTRCYDLHDLDKLNYGCRLTFPYPLIRGLCNIQRHILQWMWIASSSRLYQLYVISSYPENSKCKVTKDPEHLRRFVKVTAFTSDTFPAKPTNNLNPQPENIRARSAGGLDLTLYPFDRTSFPQIVIYGLRLGNKDRSII